MNNIERINLNKNLKMVIKLSKITIFVLIILTIGFFRPLSIYAEKSNTFLGQLFGSESSDNPEEVSSSIRLLVIITILALAPSIIIMFTAFTRIIVILSFMRNALGTQQMPPNQILIGLALFLTFFIMRPIFIDINEKAIQPFQNEEISQEDALFESSFIIKKFMLSQIRDEKDLELFVKLGNIETPVVAENLPLSIITPAFLINELTIAFKIGFLIYIPFLVIDMIVSSTLMSMGMIMLPPVMISLPFKILLFIMAGGWNLVIKSMLESFIK